MLAGSAVTQAAAYVQICILDEEGTRLWGGQLLFSSSNSQLPLALADWQGLLRLVLLPKQVSTGVGGQLARLEICGMCQAIQQKGCGPICTAWSGNLPVFPYHRCSREAAAPSRPKYKVS